MTRTGDQRQFTVVREEPVDNMSLFVVCERCGGRMFCGGLAALADLNDAADEHAEACP